MMKKFKKIMAVALSACLGLSALAMTAGAANVTTEPLATIDTEKTASFTLYKYDLTNAKKDGVWDEDNFISTGWNEGYMVDDKVNDLGNGQTSNGYAIKGVEFTLLKVADITTFTESERDGHAAYNLTQVLYGFDRTKAADLLAAIGLADGMERYAGADILDGTGNTYYYQSDVLNKAMSAALGNNSTTVKNALEAYVAAQSADTVVMDETDENGMSTVDKLALGLYIVVETKVPEMVTSTTDPFFVSLPMTTVTGNLYSVSPEGGHRWNYDVVVYPKNNTGIPTLEKTVRESKNDTGHNEGATDDITDGYAHTATASSGDVVEYQIISTLPNITSTATYLSVYSFFDTVSAGLSYNKFDGVKIEIFEDKACKELVTTWTEEDGNFTVTYEDGTDGGVNSTMAIDVTADGLAEINGVTTDNTVAGELATAYSNHTIRITYSATVASDPTTIIGDGLGALSEVAPRQSELGNCNTVVLTWKRSNSDYYDTLIDDCHVYTFGLELTKLFSDKESEAAEELFSHVKFKLWNDSDKYWVEANLNISEGIYYVTDHVADEADATEFVPVTSGNGKYGVIIVRGLEDDTYIITECETANGYTLLKDSITVIISTVEDQDCDIYAEDVLGVLQNDPRYSFDGDLNLFLENIPQDQLAHKLLTASATVDGNDVTMKTDGEIGRGSENALVPLTVVNTRGFDLPQTGERGMWLYPVIGMVGMASAALVIVLFSKKKRVKEAA